jgi:ribosomal protein S18 acetylase RimI-like enzyme
VSDVIIRAANVEDAAEIANVHINAWREAYKGIFPQDYLDDLPLSFKRRMKMWEKIITTKKSSTNVFVAESKASGVVGFCSVEAGQEKGFLNFGEIKAIYLLEKFQKQGIGKKLLQSSLSFLKSNKFEQAFCWVVENNPTRKFYERNGGELIPHINKVDEDLGTKIIELAYQWKL